MRRARPGQLNYASSGNGTSNHLSGAMFAAREGIKASHLPYRGGAQAITDLLRGEVQFMFYHYLPLLPHIAEGKLRALAITSAKRISALPDVPTMDEAGLDDFEVSAWFGVYAPAKMPAPLVQKIHGAISGIINAPAVKASLIEQGIDPVNGSPAGFARTDEVRDGALVESGRTGGREIAAVSAPPEAALRTSAGIHWRHGMAQRLVSNGGDRLQTKIPARCRNALAPGESFAQTLRPVHLAGA